MRFKITSQWDRDGYGRTLLRLEKSHGKFTLDEITNYLLYEGKHHGNYAILIRAGEQCCGGSGWGDEVKQPGDVVELYEVADDDTCPICGGTTPLTHCPSCGESLTRE